MSEAQHDPGGRSFFPLPPNIAGDAAYSPCGRYRHFLLRENRTLLAPGQRTALFVGLNPSTATAQQDDPTCRREQGIAWREGCRFYAKANVMDYRATEPARLRDPDVIPRSDANLDWIAKLAVGVRRDGGFIVAAWGLIHPSLRHYAEEALAALKQSGAPIYCLGLTQSGAPRHPLYLQRGAKLRPFPPVVLS